MKGEKEVWRRAFFKTNSKSSWVPTLWFKCDNHSSIPYSLKNFLNELLKIDSKEVLIKIERKIEVSEK